MLQQHAELCALALGVEAIPSLDPETLPEVGTRIKACSDLAYKLERKSKTIDVQEVPEAASEESMELPRLSTPEPAAAGTPVRLGHVEEQAPPAEAKVPAMIGSNWERVANGEAKVTLGED